ncbi:hypothetical protein FACS1894125_5170 [Actinomycetota bacterium]|nr:hypothetical protein FACS1894125_5170 [Actinomycetota bacterium]
MKNIVKSNVALGAILAFCVVFTVVLVLMHIPKSSRESYFGTIYECDISGANGSRLDKSFSFPDDLNSDKYMKLKFEIDDEGKCRAVIND